MNSNGLWARQRGAKKVVAREGDLYLLACGHRVPVSPRAALTGRLEVSVCDVCRRTPGVCSAEGCVRKPIARGVCRRHYDQQRARRRTAQFKADCPRCGTTFYAQAALDDHRCPRSAQATATEKGK